ASQPACASARVGVTASVLPRRSIAMPQYAIAQVGSCCRTPSNVLRAYRNQYECSMATPRSNSACTLASQDVGKLTLPSFSSCCENALKLSAAEDRPATNIKHLRFIAFLPGQVFSSCHVLRDTAASSTRPPE